ncbi:MAG: alpha/beta fold hydrolase [Mycobacteriales bacterium]
MHDRRPLVGSDIAVRGVRLHVVDRGAPGRRSPDKPTVLLLHGLPTTGYLWHDVVRDLEQHYRCVVPDLVGLGDSESPQDKTAYGMNQQAQTMLALLDHLGVDQVLVAGHDIGGTIAVEMAGLAPERIRGLALLSPLLHTDVWPVRAALPFTLPYVGDAALVGLQRIPGLGETVLRRTLDGDLTDAELHQYLAPVRTGAGGHGLLRVFRAVDPAGAQAVLPALDDVPTLLLWGEKDPIHPLSYGQLCRDDLPSAQWVTVSGGGHLLPTRAPQRVAEELTAFFAEAVTTTRTYEEDLPDEEPATP